jgi:ABC-type sugar transport system ATPase subunit
LREAGVAILYISHHLDEIFAIADAVTVLRDGERVGEHLIAHITPETIVGEMFGRSVGDRPVGERALTGEPPRLIVSDLHVGARVRGVDLAVEPGEIVAVTGGIGAGTSELARAVVGADKPSRGEVRIDGRLVRNRSGAASMVGFLPADRKRLGLLLDDTVADNLLLGSLAVPGPWLVRPGRDRRRAEELRQQASVKTAGVDVGVRTLSGGNQQKVIIGRWLALGSPVLVFDEPTAGIDISSKFEIYTTLRRLADEGAAIVVCTTDFQEVRQVADRVLVLRSGRVVGSCAGVDATEHRLVELEMAG